MDTKLVKKADEIYSYYHTMKLNEKKQKMAKDLIEKMCEQRRIQREEIDGYVVRKSTRVDYIWRPGIYEILKNHKRLNECLKHGNEMKERFDLSPYILPKTEEDLYIRIGRILRPNEEVAKEREELEKFLSKLQNYDLNELIQVFAQHKKMFELYNQRYDSDKKELLRTMLEAGVDQVEDFKIYEKEDRYDFDAMPSNMKERVLIATNGRKSIDLYKLVKTPGNKLDTIEVIDLNPHELEDSFRFEKRFGSKKKEFLQEKLGDDYWFVEGYKTEEDIHSRFPLSNKAIEKLMLKGDIPEREVMRQRRVDTSKEPTEFYEIISIENEEERKKGLMLLHS